MSEFLDVHNPRTGTVIGSVALLPAADLPRIARTADDAFRTWSGVPVDKRSELVREMARLLAERSAELARTFSREHGKTVLEAETELARSVDTLRWSADAAVRLTQDTDLPGAPGSARRLAVDPAGPALAIVPWNFPVVVLARKLGPALVMGCSVVVKAPESCPSVIDGFLAAAADAGIPDGTVQLVHAAPQVADALVRQPEFRTVSFTGSTRVGKLVAAAAAPNLTPCVLELGGHAPAIVTADADLDLAAATLAASKFGSAGQSCAAVSRLLVDRRVVDDFVDRFVRAAPLLDFEHDTAGRPGTMGPLHNAARREAVHALVRDAVDRGAELRLGGTLPSRPGFYYPATVLTAVPTDARVMAEEPFGPLAPIVAYDEEDAAVDIANSTDFALSACVFGNRADANRLAERLDAGAVAVNGAPGAVPDAPLGGRGASGYGYEGGDAGLLAFGRLKLLNDRSAEPSPPAEPPSSGRN